MEIDSINVYGIKESIVASGLPMQETYDWSVFESRTLGTDLYDMSNPHFSRAVKLCSHPNSSGHLTFLSGITVQMNITATIKWWEQWQRYHFQQIVSSMSTMHRLRKMMQENTIRFDPNTHQSVIGAFKKLLDDPDVSDTTLAYSCPTGVLLTARVSTNYLQLRTMYQQRHNHKLVEWREFCELLRSFPCGSEFIVGQEYGKRQVS